MRGLCFAQHDTGSRVCGALQGVLDFEARVRGGGGLDRHCCVVAMVRVMLCMAERVCEVACDCAWALGLSSVGMKV